MKNIIPSSLLLVFGLGLTVIATPFAFAAPTLSISVSIPAAALESGDLDARDAFNRPLRSAAVRESFEQLWIKSLNQLLLNALTPAHVQLMALLNSSWDGFAGQIRGKFSTAWRFLKAWLQFKKSEIFIRWFSLLFQRSPAPTEPTFLAIGNSFLYLIHAVIASTRLLR